MIQEIRKTSFTKKTVKILANLRTALIKLDGSKRKLFNPSNWKRIKRKRVRLLGFLKSKKSLGLRKRAF